MIKLTFFWRLNPDLEEDQLQLEMLTNFKSVETQEFLWQNLEKVAPLSPNTSLYFI